MIDLAIGIMSLLTLVAVNMVLFMPMRSGRKDIIRTVAVRIFIWGSVLISLVCVARTLAGLLNGDLLMRCVLWNR
ncbi:MAG TPA: hypothetical protein DCQ76_03670 [Ruminococcaceae bacterium]|nr:hypothetical protein [Oscillospiraceae bacterium]